MQETYQFIDEKGTFELEGAENYSYLYFPVAGENGMKSALTPNLGGDCKLDQNTFLLEPVSVENLHNNRSSRNFWCHIASVGDWSAMGVSAEEIGKKFMGRSDKSKVTAGLMWHKVMRASEKYQLSAEITSFVPVGDNLEIMYVEITNTGDSEVCFTPTAAIPLYGRSADNIRDHRHVTSLLHRIRTTENGVLVAPTLSFDERGHQKCDVTYFVCGFDGNGKAPGDFYPVVEDFIGEGGSFERPEAVVKNKKGAAAGSAFAGLEAVGGLHFGETTLAPQETARFTILLGAVRAGEFSGSAADGSQEDQYQAAEAYISGITEKYRTADRVQEALFAVKAYWEEQVSVSFHTGDAVFDQYMHWVSFQPTLRRIYGCSFLPHHDYGKGGRGWRDLWQDCLALLLMNPAGVRGMLLDNFRGVRIDGTNATIIGAKQGEFLADRNNITRVWMDHGVWPFFTTKLYIDETGDMGILDERLPYFKDAQTARGTKKDEAWNDAYGSRQKTADGEIYEGTVLEHLLLQNLTACHEVGEHGHIRLRDADWNDALDMASRRGESVAFTNAYAGNLTELAELLEAYGEKTKRTTVSVAKEITLLLDGDASRFESAEEKNRTLERYTQACFHVISGETKELPIRLLAKNLRQKAAFMMCHIRETEWVTDDDGNGWFNGYYDNHGARVEGAAKDGVRMMLTGQVFSIMAGTAEEKQIVEIVKSADKYLYRENLGGYCLNTDFGEVKTDLGRMFGFAYGEKENGAVFSHMAVMYANALYRRGFAVEGCRALLALYRQSVNFPVSRIYPGIPEYFNGRGRGMYHYLTGAASWYLLTVVTEMYGVKGCLGDMVLMPKLLKSQFDGAGTASVTLPFAGKKWKIIYENKNAKEYGEYKVSEAVLDGTRLPAAEGISVRLTKEAIEGLKEIACHELRVILE